ncbi:peptidase [Bombiscardovia apis]|uniref:Peptidase n=1 Tax=Bombiscardovia apis TaxID=2932182 RepID=A0ABN6SEB0_9BIFI|nr:trypsin-like peptidase domain-containing protein [Bombiscardovia apis]BDR53963.1 peptidase [Bombiscardovia apis]
MADDKNINPWNGQGGQQPWQPNQASGDSNNASQQESGHEDSHDSEHSLHSQPSGTVGEQTGASNVNGDINSSEQGGESAHMAPTTSADSPESAATLPASSTPTPADSHAPYQPAPLFGAYAPTTQMNNGNPAQGEQPTQPIQPVDGQGSANGNGNGGGFIFGAPASDNSSEQGNNASRQSPLFGVFSRPQGQQNQPGQPQQPAPAGGPGIPGSFPPAGGQPGQQPQPGQPYPAQGVSNQQSRTVWTAVIAAVLSAALMLGLGWAAISNGWITVPSSSSLSSVNSNNSGSGSAKVEAGQAPDWQAVAKKVSESVVSIQVQVKDGVGAGSGAIVDNQGHVITNNHVVSGAEKIQVTLSNGQLYTATVVGADSTADLAVIKLEDSAKDLKPVEFADSDKLAVGEGVMAIGNPLGYENTATTGIISALNRPVSVMDESGSNPVVTNAIQLDAAINQGNSGGPTFNAAGQVVGINSSIASTTNSKAQAGSIGIGFAIPSNLVKRIGDEIIKDGKVKHVALGITIQSGNAEADGVTRGGAKVVKVNSGGPADKAGIKANDTIVAFNDQAVSNNYSLLGFVRAAQFGSNAKITVVRDGKALDLNVTMDQEEQAVTATPKSDPNGRSKKKSDGNSDGDSNGDSNGNGNNNGNDGDGFFDPFDYFFGQ